MREAEAGSGGSAVGHGGNQDEGTWGASLSESTHGLCFGPTHWTSEMPNLCRQVIKNYI